MVVGTGTISVIRSMEDHFELVVGTWKVYSRSSVLSGSRIGMRTKIWTLLALYWLQHHSGALPPSSWCNNMPT